MVYCIGVVFHQTPCDFNRKCKYCIILNLGQSAIDQAISDVSPLVMELSIMSEENNQLHSVSNFLSGERSTKEIDLAFHQYCDLSEGSEFDRWLRSTAAEKFIG